MKLISFNVNGIRAVIKKGFYDFVKQTDPDILCLQETKAQPTDVELDLPGYHHYWHSAKKKGYAGTMILAKKEPSAIQYDFPGHEGEGRFLLLEYDDYFIITVYVPNAQHGLTRLDYRMRWDADLLTYLKELEKKKPIIICGDLNVAHEEIDLANPKSNRGNPGFTDEERAGFDQFIKAGLIDTYRLFVKEGGHYSWWSYRSNARARNIGWRIDYVLVSASLKDRVKEAFILDKVEGSDHCPVGIKIE